MLACITVSWPQQAKTLDKVRKQMWTVYEMASFGRVLGIFLPTLGCQPEALGRIVATTTGRAWRAHFVVLLYLKILVLLSVCERVFCSESWHACNRVEKMWWRGRYGTETDRTGFGRHWAVFRHEESERRPERGAECASSMKMFFCPKLLQGRWDSSLVRSNVATETTTKLTATMCRDRMSCVSPHMMGVSQDRRPKWDSGTEDFCGCIWFTILFL